MDKQFLQKVKPDLKSHLSSNTTIFLENAQGPSSVRSTSQHWLDKYPPAKLDKQFLQKAELTLPLEETDPEPDNVVEGS